MPFRHACAPKGEEKIFSRTIINNKENIVMAPKKATKTTKEKKVSAPKGEALEEVLVTDEYLASHPELAEQGISAGDTIEVTATPKETSSKLDLDGEVSILRGDEYVRTYQEGSKEAVQSFLSKDGKYIAVDPSTIVSINVSWRESIKEKDQDTGTMKDTGRMTTKTRVFSEKDGSNWMSQARQCANETTRRSCTAKFI